MPTLCIPSSSALPPATDNPQWVVVENAGLDDEAIWSEHFMLSTAHQELKKCGGRDNGFDLMRRRPDGTLTTEF